MDRKSLAAIGTLALTLAGCNQQQPAAPHADTPPAATETATPLSGATPTPVQTPNTVGPASGDAMNDGYPDLSPAKLTPEAERTEKGARNVLLSWARAIELHEFDQAWNLMSDADHKKWSKAAWTKMFADLDKILVAVPDGMIEGAAGSSYYSSKATITAVDNDGRPVRYEGPVVLRRVNDVDGATAEQLHWHIESVTLHWVH